MATAAITGPYANIQGSNLGTALLELLQSNDIVAGDGPSYDLCKKIYLHHPLGAKIASKPIEIAQSEKREISVNGGGTASDKIRDEFEKKWKQINGDGLISNIMTLSRVYGAAAIAVLEEGVANRSPVDLKTIYKKKFTFNVYDPLNIAGGLQLDQDPLSMSFLHVMNVSVSGEPFHRSRIRVMMNEDPIYIAWTSSGYGYTGRSVYQRALLPMKSFIQTMITDDMVSRKAGVIVAKMKQVGSIINQRMRTMFGLKRNVVKEAEVNNVISISTEEMIESIDLKNISEPFKLARMNIIENIASAVPMPAQMLTEESFGASFHEGSEDARAQARFVRRVQERMDPLYDWLDAIVMRLAWTPEYFFTIQAEYPEEFKEVEFEDFFWRCSNTFTAVWPSMMQEPDSELAKADKVKLESVTQLVVTLLPNLPKEEKAKVIMWACDQFNEMKLLFGGNRLELDPEAIAAFEDPTPPAQIPDTKNEFRNDSIQDFQTKLLDFIEKKQKQGTGKRLEMVK